MIPRAIATSKSSPSAINTANLTSDELFKPPQATSLLPATQVVNTSISMGNIEHQLISGERMTYGVETILSRSVHAIAQQVSLEAAYLALLFAAYATDADAPWETSCIVQGKTLMQQLGWETAASLSLADCQRLQNLVTSLYTWFVTICEIDRNNQQYQKIRVPLWFLGDFNLQGSLPPSAIAQSTGSLSSSLEPQELKLQVSPGSWISLFPEAVSVSVTEALCQYGDLAKSTLLISRTKHPLAARLAILLTASCGFCPTGVYQVQQLLSELIPGLALSLNAFPERRLETIAQWDEALCILRQLGWAVEFDPDTYPEELRPAWSLPYSSFSTTAQRSELWIQNWLKAKVTLRPTRLIHQQVKMMSDRYQSESGLAEDLNTQPEALAFIPGEVLEKALLAKGISQSKFAEQLNLDRSMVNRWIKGSRVIQPKHQAKIWQLLSKELEPLMKSVPTPNR